MRLFTVSWLVAAGVGALAAQQYFPPGVLDTTPQGHELKAGWYGKQLKALHEPSLWELSRNDPKVEAYRFLWLRSLHHPVAVRLVVRQGGSGWMHVRMTSGQSGYETGRIIRYGVSWLTKSKTQSLVAALAAADFWNLPTLVGVNEARPGLDGTVGIGLGGAQWVVEGVKDGRYHVVDRWSPGSEDPVREIGMLSLKLGRFRVRPSDVY
jgi:hypothetical protein